MSKKTRHVGIIEKTVRLPVVHPPAGYESYGIGVQGYGILKERSGRALFFDSSAVALGDFDRLEPGTKVTYTKDPGPFAKANHVSVCDRPGDWGQMKTERTECRTTMVD